MMAFNCCTIHRGEEKSIQRIFNKQYHFQIYVIVSSTAIVSWLHGIYHVRFFKNQMAFSLPTLTLFPNKITSAYDQTCFHRRLQTKDTSCLMMTPVNNYHLKSRQGDMSTCTHTRFLSVFIY